MKCYPCPKGTWQEKESELHICVSFLNYQHCWFTVLPSLQETLNTFPFQEQSGVLGFLLHRSTVGGFCGPKKRELLLGYSLRGNLLRVFLSTDSGKNNLFLLCFIFGSLSEEEFLHQILFFFRRVRLSWSRNYRLHCKIFFNTRN